MEQITIFWFRRDLRITDNAALFHALKGDKRVLPVFIFDKNILQNLDANDKRVSLIHSILLSLKKDLNTLQSDLQIYFDTPLEVFKKLTEKYTINHVFTNHDYEPYAKKRDEEIAIFLKTKNIIFDTFKDQVIFEKDEILKEDGTPYHVFTPYSKKWKSKINEFYLKPYDTEKYFSNFFTFEKKLELFLLEEMGFEKQEIVFEKPEINNQIIVNYHQTRDFPAMEGTTQMSVHLRFGTISIRQLAKIALQKNEKYLNELIWRDFYQSILWHYPQVVSLCFKPKYEKINWINNEKDFEAWCNGNTGYPIVDAGMRELNSTGWMHNRVRMIVASFLCKHLMIDWRWGETYFANKLLDFDLASNNGGWQWAAGSGVDAAPYFRIFNPAIQTKKFDANLTYIKKWVPEFESFFYQKPIVVHEDARKRCLELYQKALNNISIY